MLLKTEHPETRDLILLYSIAKEIQYHKVKCSMILYCNFLIQAVKTISQKFRICPSLEVCFKVILHLTGLSFVINLISPNR